MQRAAVLIGVKKTGKLPELQDAVPGVRKMEKWAKDQGFDPDLVKVITDEAGPVHAQHIIDAIEQLVELSTIEQLLVYFAGHGVNIRRGEYWLLSKAPKDANAAVNVEASVALARSVGIPHVVMISDACRTAPEGVQAQSVTGSLIFPNEESSAPENPVDLFFASTLGTPALEIKDPSESASAFTAIYTEALVETLRGLHPEAIEQLIEGGKTIGFIRPEPLRDYLRGALAARLAGRRTTAGPLNQVPDARITSKADAWLARFVDDRVERKGAKGRSRRKAHVPPTDTLQTVSQQLLRAALSDDVARLKEQLGQPMEITNMNLLVNTVGITRPTFGPTHLETGCGFKVRGQRFAAAFAVRAQTELGKQEDLVWVHNPPRPGTSVLLTFRDGTGLALPAIPDFIGALTFEDSELSSVSYEPSEHSLRWNVYALQEEQLRALKSVIASTARLGVFRLEGDDAPALARRMQMAKNTSPAMALYAAYAYFEQQRGNLIVEMRDFQKADLGFEFFDVALLARGLNGWNGDPRNDLLPSFPLLSQGWALLPAFRVSLPGQLAELQRCLIPSLWSIFDPRGVKILEAAMQSGALP